VTTAARSSCLITADAGRAAETAARLANAAAARMSFFIGLLLFSARRVNRSRLRMNRLVG
jgi:hypothetical protein